jgi:hypothetical protein
MSDAQQLSLFGSADTRTKIAKHIKHILKNERQPSVRELVAELDRVIGIVARWDLRFVHGSLLSDKDLTRAGQAYLTSLLEGEDLIVPDVLADPEYTYGAKDVEPIPARRYDVSVTCNGLSARRSPRI